MHVPRPDPAVPGRREAADAVHRHRPTCARKPPSRPSRPPLAPPAPHPTTPNTYNHTHQRRPSVGLVMPLASPRPQALSASKRAPHGCRTRDDSTVTWKRRAGSGESILTPISPIGYTRFDMLIEVRDGDTACGALSRRPPPLPLTRRLWNVDSPKYKTWRHDRSAGQRLPCTPPLIDAAVALGRGTALATSRPLRRRKTSASST